MFIKQKLSLLAATAAAMTLSGAAGAVTLGLTATPGTLTVNATLTSACSVSLASTITLAFGAQDADTSESSLDSFQVACSSDLTPTIYATGARVMKNALIELPFNLSLTEGALANDLPTESPGVTFTLTKDGDLHTVPLYASVSKDVFKGLAGGTYTTAGISVIVAY